MTSCMNEDEIVNDMMEQFKFAPKSLQDDFRNCPRDQLIQYHHTLGRHIRNSYSLWQLEWVPEIVNGVDMSDNHPDAVSMRIVNKLWEKVQ